MLCPLLLIHVSIIMNTNLSSKSKSKVKITQNHIYENTNA